MEYNRQLIKMKKLLYSLLTLAFIACNGNDPTSSSTTDDYVDLGLPSGTKWKASNERNKEGENLYLTHEEAVEAFNENLPTKQQWEELKSECEWYWYGKGYKIVGKNGKSINLEAKGQCHFNPELNDYETWMVDEIGYYWSSTTEDFYEQVCPVHLYFSSTEIGIGPCDKSVEFSIRLIK